MASNDSETIVNPLHPSVVDRVDPDFARVYNQYQAPRLRADQVPFEIYDQDRPKYTFPTDKVRGPVPSPARTTTHTIPVTTPPGEIALQITYPTTAPSSSSSSSLLPAYIDFHGGGFVIGNLATDAAWCAKIAHRIPCIAINVDYRLAPAHPHPTPIRDSLDALHWIVAHAASLGVDATRLAVGGFSAGGCLAAALAHLAMTTTKIPPLRLQVLIVPVLDARYIGTERERDAPYESYRALEFAPCLPLQRLRWFYDLWLDSSSGGGSQERKEKWDDDFTASPMVAPQFWGGLAPASLHLAELDPLVDEGRLYHEKLCAAGTRSAINLYKGVGHPFAHWAGEVPAARELEENVVAALKEAFHLDVV